MGLRNILFLKFVRIFKTGFIAAITEVSTYTFFPLFMVCVALSRKENWLVNLLSPIREESESEESLLFSPYIDIIQKYIIASIVEMA